MSIGKQNIFNDPKIFSERLKIERRKAGFTNESLAEEAGLSVDTLISYTRAEPSIPNMVNAAALARALEVSLDYLCGLSEVKEINEERRISPYVLLMNLYIATKDSGLSVNVDTSGRNITFKSENAHIAYFFDQVQNCKTTSDVRELAMRFDNMKLIGNQIVDKSTYEKYLAEQSIYGDITDEDVELHPEEVRELIDIRTKEKDL